MSRFDPVRDGLVGEVLRRMDAKAPSPRQLEALSARIRTEAMPLLDARRFTAPSWSEYVAHWAGTLVPLGVLTAVAAALCLAWLTHQQMASSNRALERAALLGAAAGGSAPGDLLDLATVDGFSSPSGRRR